MAGLTMRCVIAENWREVRFYFPCERHVLIFEFDLGDDIPTYWHVDPVGTGKRWPFERFVEALGGDARVVSLEEALEVIERCSAA